MSKIDDKMELCINDYKLNLYDYHDYDNFDTFKSELGKVFGFLRNYDVDFDETDIEDRSIDKNEDEDRKRLKGVI